MGNYSTELSVLQVGTILYCYKTTILLKNKNWDSAFILWQQIIKWVYKISQLNIIQIQTNMDQLFSIAYWALDSGDNNR